VIRVRFAGGVKFSSAVKTPISTVSAFTGTSSWGPNAISSPIMLRSAHPGVIASVICAFVGSPRLTVREKPVSPFGRESIIIWKSSVSPSKGIVPPSAVTVAAVTAPVQTNRRMTAAMVIL